MHSLWGPFSCSSFWLLFTHHGDSIEFLPQAMHMHAFFDWPYRNAPNCSSWPDHPCHPANLLATNLFPIPWKLVTRSTWGQNFTGSSISPSIWPSTLAYPVVLCKRESTRWLKDFGFWMVMLKHVEAHSSICMWAHSSSSLTGCNMSPWAVKTQASMADVNE